uniref:Phospholipase/carboxylesterase/thioesterase domain-containing protein n=1 Tax=Compsopogon caeruleus TaxID=31354 RepID=A0A6T6ARW1_9RHOD|mmetsp:Transcript_12029/g.24504  ORF Transcript_12029/g.24504 Transcript_12029/m.24504 type:complete len:273 (+) Transcript_12029:59-877(+)
MLQVLLFAQSVGKQGLDWVGRGRCSCRRRTFRALSTSMEDRQGGDGHGGAGMVIPSKLRGDDPSRKSSLIWLHGLGDTAQGWASAMPMFQVPYMRFVLPTASSRHVRVAGPFPVPAWSDILDLDENAPEDREGFLGSVQRIQSIIDGEIASGVLPSRIAVGGFSQGGAVALSVMMRSRVTLGAFIGASTWLPLRDSYPAELSEANQKTPLIVLHGDRDGVVSPRWGQMSADFVKSSCGVSDVTVKIYRGMDHSACPEEFVDIGNFLRKAIPE